ncbi:uvrD/REP helicase N-terminal domain protein [Mycobacteroides abscessus subsp. bolletii 1513]|uniref:UvrD/REP helicase N-terminal domain protein n=1 Tax=Mycobacteroides abscessus subsp. bolletii 1513 TaxID=1299321 RepID=X8DIV8_9MYCO|nr:uvrD/REP helicase N-terminal domain protein [Mycobacteroides abscessus subsp. bolletii 1513]
MAIVEQLIALMRTRGVLDFGAQMALSARLAADHPIVGQTQRERYRVVLLDEYQDTGMPNASCCRPCSVGALTRNWR